MALRDLFSTINIQPATPKRVVGIDIGASSIKVVELENRDDVITLTTYGEMQLGPYDEGKAIGQAVTLVPSLERQSLVDILRESAVKAKSAVFAMPLSSSFVTTMSLIAEPAEDISPRVRVEARKYIPIPMAEVTLDWAEVDTKADDNPNSRSILLAAIQNDALNRFTTLLQTVEFKNPPTEIECFSTIRSLYTTAEQNVAIIDIGAVSTKMYLVRAGLLQRMYRVRAGGAIYTEKVAADLKLSFEAAETLKRTTVPGDPRFQELQKIHTAMYARVLREFAQVLQEYEVQAGAQVDAVLLTGGGALFPQVESLVTDALGRPATLALPFNKVAYPAFMEDTMNQIGASFVVALGAALRTFE